MDFFEQQKQYKQINMCNKAFKGILFYLYFLKEIFKKNQ